MTDPYTEMDKLQAIERDSEKVQNFPKNRGAIPRQSHVQVVSCEQEHVIDDHLR